MARQPTSTSPDENLLELVRAIVSGEARMALRLIGDSPALVHARCVIGATRTGVESYFFEPIAHHMYAGDSALHMAAAGFRPDISQALIDKGADISAKNRRGAEPLHYAADANVWNPGAQAATIECLIRSGADPNATDKSGVPPVHRAVRTRSAAAVAALLAGGAEPRSRNNSGSTPLHLAVQNTGRGDSGTPHAVEQQRLIIGLLLGAGAQPDDKDANGKTVRDAARAEWIRALLGERA